MFDCRFLSKFVSLRPWLEFHRIYSFWRKNITRRIKQSGLFQIDVGGRMARSLPIIRYWHTGNLGSQLANLRKSFFFFFFRWTVGKCLIFDSLMDFLLYILGWSSNSKRFILSKEKISNKEIKIFSFPWIRTFCQMEMFAPSPTWAPK